MLVLKQETTIVGFGYCRSSVRIQLPRPNKINNLARMSDLKSSPRIQAGKTLEVAGHFGRRLNDRFPGMNDEVRSPPALRQKVACGLLCRPIGAGASRVRPRIQYWSGNEICLGNSSMACARPLRISPRPAGTCISSRDDLELPPSTRRRACHPGRYPQPHCARAGHRNGRKGPA